VLAVCLPAGKKVEQGERILDVVVPAGVANGEQLVLL